ncbi:MAG: DUF3093 domain-containing protein [Candidatus Planktophila sp.]|nr:DUF3093 domain-containing protein [Candidatus Planktophila sp.]
MRFKEVIRAPLWLVAFVYFLFLSMVLSIWAALGNTPALVTFGVLTIWLIFLFFRTALVIQMDESFLYVGQAKIERKHIGSAIALNNAELKLIRTRDADPSAYLAIRFWASKAAKVEVSDNRDMTPYWLISSKNPQRLVEALKS